MIHAYEKKSSPEELDLLKRMSITMTEIRIDKHSPIILSTGE